MMAKPLSPAAEAAWEAYNEVMERVGVFEDSGDAIGAALHAVALHLPNDCRVLAAIADELEGRAGIMIHSGGSAQSVQARQDAEHG